MADEYVILSSSFNWGDEFDLDGFYIMEKTDFDRSILALKVYYTNLLYPDRDEMYFGTNEYMSFSSAEDIIDQLDLTYVPYSVAKTIGDHVGWKVGIFTYSTILDYIEYDCDDSRDYEAELVKAKSARKEASKK